MCKQKKSKGSGQMLSSDPDDLINHPLANLINRTQKCFDLLCRQTSFTFRLGDLFDHTYDQIVRCREIIIRGKRANWYLISFFSTDWLGCLSLCVFLQKKTLKLYHISSFNRDGIINCKKSENFYFIFSLKVWSWNLRRKYSEAFYYDERSIF